MKRQQLNSHEINETKNYSLQKSKSGKSVFYECNIYSLKHILESSNGNPLILRENVLKYCRLSQPYVTDLVITHNYLTQEEIILDINRESAQDVREKVKNHIEGDDNACPPTDLIISTKKQDKNSQLSQEEVILASQHSKTLSYRNQQQSNKSQDLLQNNLASLTQLTVQKIEDNSNEDDEQSQDKNQIMVNDLVLFKKRSTVKRDTAAEKSQTDIKCLDDFQLNQLKMVTVLSNSSPKQDQLISSQNLISDQEYAIILCSLMEILGVTVADYMKTLTKSLNLEKISKTKLRYLHFIKTHKFNQMIKRYLEPVDNPINDPNSIIYMSSFLDSTNQPTKTLFNSPYDSILQKIYPLYQNLLNQMKSIAEAKEVIQEILTILSDATSNQASLIYSTTEKLNLNALKEMFSSSTDYFTDQLNDLFQRKFFFFNEFIEIIPETIDEVQLMSIIHYQQFDMKFAFYLVMSINALANSKGGVCFLGIHNIYTRVRGISIKEISGHNFIQEIRKYNFANHPPIHFDINLLKVERISENSKEMDNYIIKIHVFPRKTNVVYKFKDRWGTQVFVRNKGGNLRLTEEQVQYLESRRNNDKDIPNFQDYIEIIEETHDTNKEKNNSQVTNLLMPCMTENEEHTQKEQNKNSNDDSVCLYTIGQINSKREEIISSCNTNSGRVKSSLREDSQTHFKNKNEEINHQQKSRLSSKLCPQSQPYPSPASKFSRHHCQDQPARNCYEKSSFQNKSLSSLIDYPKKRTNPKPSTQEHHFPNRIDKLLLSHELRGIEQWKKNILLKTFNQDNSIPTFPEFKVNHPLKATESELSQMLPNQCFMIPNNEKGGIKMEKVEMNQKFNRKYAGSNSIQLYAKKCV